MAIQWGNGTWGQGASMTPQQYAAANPNWRPWQITDSPVGGWGGTQVVAPGSTSQAELFRQAIANAQSGVNYFPGQQAQQTAAPWQTPTGTTGVGANWTYNPETQKFGGVFGGERSWSQIPQNVRGIVSQKPWFQQLTQYAQQNRPMTTAQPYQQQPMYNPYQQQQYQQPAYMQRTPTYNPYQQQGGGWGGYQAQPYQQQNPWANWGQQLRTTQPYQYPSTMNQSGGNSGVFSQSQMPW